MSSSSNTGDVRRKDRIAANAVSWARSDEAVRVRIEEHGSGKVYAVTYFAAIGETKRELLGRV